MQLTRAADYAVRVMIHMAGLPAGTTVRVKQLAAAVAVPETFLAKVMQALSRADLVRSRRGQDGGFELVPNSLQATILDVITAIDGPVQLNACLGECGTCEHKDWCPAHSVWAEAQIAMLNILNRDTIADLATKAAQRRQEMNVIGNGTQPADAGTSWN